ncbi:MAG: T9SS type A sorting domain-containing protein [Calditrichae bacterium]|nr:T9SS type A sorting domain-containing protein [Calditrichia bacterium]
MFHIITFLSESVKLWAGTIHGVWLSTDNGASWEERSDGLPPDPYNSSIIRVNGNLVSSVKFGGSGIFRSTNEAMSWEDYGDGLPFLTSIEKLMTYNDKIIAATSDGLWQRDIITGVDSNDGNPAKTFALYQNYPNPFNPTTTIKFQTGDFGFVSLKIYDIVGREVAVLVNENLPAGSYEYEWDASGLRSGVYLYSLETGSFKQTRKLMVLK